MRRKERKEWNWQFRGFETPASNRPVKDWIVNECPTDGRDDLVDILLYMKARPQEEWDREHFRSLDDGISEIRFTGSGLTLRIYGYFGPSWFVQSYTFLVGNIKKVKNDVDAKRLAKSRRDQIEKREARVHDFVIQG